MRRREFIMGAAAVLAHARLPRAAHALTPAQSMALSADRLPS